MGLKLHHVKALPKVGEYFAIFEKNSKIQNGRHFWRHKFFFKIGIATLQRYPVGQKYCRNRSI